MSLAALRRCTTALMVTALQTVSGHRHFCSNGQHAYFALQRSRISHSKTNPHRGKKFRATCKIIRAPLCFLVPRFYFPSSLNSFFDLTPARIPTIIMRTSLLWRADKLAHWEIPNAGCMDGAKIYFCYRRCCFLTWKGSCLFLHRLSPRKSRFQSHLTEMRSVPERRSRYDEPLSAR